MAPLQSHIASRFGRPLQVVNALAGVNQGREIRLCPREVISIHTILRFCHVEMLYIGVTNCNVVALQTDCTVGAFVANILLLKSTKTDPLIQEPLCMVCENDELVDHLAYLTGCCRHRGRIAGGITHAASRATSPPGPHGISRDESKHRSKRSCNGLREQSQNLVQEATAGNQVNSYIQITTKTTYDSKTSSSCSASSPR